MRTVNVAMVFCGAVLALAISLSTSGSITAQPRAASVVLVLVESNLTWETATNTPGLTSLFRDGAVASVSTAQGRTAEDRRIGYVLIGAGARADTSLLPEDLPKDHTGIPGAFDGPAATIRAGALGDALAASNIQRAAIGESAALVVMDSQGRVPQEYDAGNPRQSLKKALDDGASFIAVQASSPREADEVVESARSKGATVAVAAPNAPDDSANLTPFALSGTKGLLYSPGTRTAGLLSNEDIAPTLLERLDVEAPPEMTGRAAMVRPGSVPDAARLQERLAFVDEDRAPVWAILVGAVSTVFVAGGLRWKREGLRVAVLFLAAMPVGTLIAGAIPVTNAVVTSIVAVLAAGGLVAVAQRFFGPLEGLALVALATAAALVADAAFGGSVMGFSVLGHDPAYGARFYGIGNEYSAVVAGALPLGTGLMASRWPGLTAAVPVIGVLTILAIGLPAMGADVGGSLALGFGFGAMMGSLRGGRLVSISLWAAGGFSLAVMLFVVGGLISPDASHGARAASGDVALYEVAARKVVLSVRHLLNPLWILSLAALAYLSFVGWRRARGAAVAAGIIGAVAAAVASGALNDSGILSTLLALVYPAALGAMVLVGSYSQEKT